MSGDASQTAFLARIDRHRAILFKVANAYCRNQADREDLAQETIVQLWRSYGRFDERARFATWMYRIALNVAISFARSERRKRRGLVPAGTTILEDLPAPEEAENDARLDVVRELIDWLAPLDRAVMVLYLDDRPYAEIADILGISQTNVATKIGRIKERLKRGVTGRTT